jgi:hypothetical protein
MRGKRSRRPVALAASVLALALGASADTAAADQTASDSTGTAQAGPVGVSAPVRIASDGSEAGGSRSGSGGDAPRPEGSGLAGDPGDSSPGAEGAVLGRVSVRPAGIQLGGAGRNSGDNTSASLPFTGIGLWLLALLGAVLTGLGLPVRSGAVSVRH